MTLQSLPFLTPLLITAGTGIAVMLAASFVRRTMVPHLVALIGLILALASLPGVPRGVFDTTYAVDGLTMLLQGFVLLSAIGVTLIAPAWLDQHPELDGEEFYLLTVLGTCGALVLSASTSFLTLFLGMETLAIASYGLAAYAVHRNQSLEAGLKYLVMGGASAAILLFGAALAYAGTGSLEYSVVASQLTVATPDDALLIFAGLLLVFIGVAFKLALVPFHFWTPDVYEGAPAPAAALFASVSKLSMVAVLLRLFGGVVSVEPRLLNLLFGISIASMVVGSLLTLQQSNLKRLLGASSIAHLGYVLLAFVANGADGQRAVVGYLGAYALSSILVFGALSRLGDENDVVDLRGAGKRDPVAGFAILVGMASMAGMPFTAGFVAKFAVLTAGISHGLWAGAIVLVATSVVSAYAYLRVVGTMYIGEPRISVSPRTAFALIALALVVIAWGVYPSVVLDAIATEVGAG